MRAHLHSARKVGAAIFSESGKEIIISNREEKPKYHWQQKLAGKWQPTPPDYFDGVEYCWGDITSFVLDSAAQFKPHCSNSLQAPMRPA